MAVNYTTNCENAINRAVGRNLTDDEMVSVIEEMNDSINRIRSENQGISAEDAALRAVEEVSNADSLARAIEARNKIINERVFMELSDFIERSFPDRPDMGISAILSGRNEARLGSRDSVHIEQQNLKAKYFNGLVGELDSAGLVKVFASGSLDKEVTNALFALSKNLDTAGMNNQAIDIARTIRKWQDVAKNDVNKAGAWIGTIDNYITSQTHDMYKIRSDTFESWRDFILPLLDRSTFGNQSPTQFLRNVYDNLVTGNHMRSDRPDWLSGFKGSQNIAKKTSQNRVLNFKDGPAWFDYNSRYGSGNLRETIFASLNSLSETTGMMRKLGTNPENMLMRLSDSITDRLRGEHNTKAEIDFSNKFEGIMRKLYPEVAGLTRIPANHMMARLASSARAIESMTKLGGATLSSFNDIPMAALEMTYQGKDLFTSMIDSVKGKFKSYKADDRKELAKALGVYAEKMNEEIAYRFSGDVSVPGKVSKLMRNYFKLNLLNWWTESGRHSAAFSTSNWLARNTRTSFDNLNGNLKRVLSLHNIEKAEWELYSKMEKYTMRGNEYLVPENIITLSDQDIASYLTQKGMSATDIAIADTRELLTDRLRKYILDRSIISVSDPTPRNKAVLNQGTQAGTMEGELFRFIGQFKAFTVSFMQNHLGRELFGRGYTPAALGERSINSLTNALRNGNGELLGLANAVVWMTAFGYLSMQTKEMAKGKNPRPADLKSIQAAFLQGGGLGIYGDFLFGEVNRFGNGPVVSMMGPVVSDADQIVTLYQRAINGDAKAGDAFRFMVDHTPYLNIPYIKTTANYLFLNRLQENLSPGSLDRYRERAVKDQGNDFIIPPSQFMLGK